MTASYGASRRPSPGVIAGLDPAIHPGAKEMDPRVKPAGDGAKGCINFIEALSGQLN
jgi:hypothetical protein